ncbi:MAG: class I SAM-dependent methyltransferase [Flavobacteriaceae bacterium]
MRLITRDDFVDTYVKIKQRGFAFFSSKFNLNEVKRAKSAFNHSTIDTSNWWIIPKVIERWNLLVTGNKDLGFVDFTVNTFLKDKNNIKMLSLGSGNCSSELKFASYKNFEDILCVDISNVRLQEAKKIAEHKKLTNINFSVSNANTYTFPKNHFDIIYFRASLHHFKNVDHLVGKLIKDALKPNGFLIIDEYVGPNRLQFSKNQITAINKAITLIPKKYRKRYKLNLYKNKISGSGLLRMKIADPSECIDSENILPSIHNNFETIYEANYGGNILAAALKDIAHHFREINSEKEIILNNLFEFEDDYLKKHPSDFVFGIYKPLTL